MKRYSIKDIEKLTGIKAHTLRIWEQRYNFLTPHRTDTNIRFYDDEQLKKLLNVSLLVSRGHKISKICKLSDYELNLKIKEIYETSDQEIGEQTIPFKINSLIVSMLDLNENKFNQIIATSLMKRGMAQTISMVLFPFMQRLQIMWRTGEITTAQEHFIMNLIRQKLMVAIDSIPIAPNNAEKFILFLPENTMNDIDILFYAYFLKLNGKQMLNLGKDINLYDLKSIQDIAKPNIFMTYVEEPTCCIEVQNNILPIAESFPNQEIWLIGNLDILQSLKLPENIKLISNLESLQGMVKPQQVF
ncbi:MAG: MerR family transcriptional regulator [Hyphomicrobiales bacterium]